MSFQGAIVAAPPCIRPCRATTLVEGGMIPRSTEMTCEKSERQKSLDGVREKRTYSLYWQVSGENNFLTPRFFELGTLDRDCPFSVFFICQKNKMQ